MLYWLIMVLLVGASAALLFGTFKTIKKNKAEAAVPRKGKKRYSGYDDDDDEDEDYVDEESYEKPRKAAGARQRNQVREPRQEVEQKPRQKKRRQWKIILEDLDTWEKYSFIFYETVGIGRGKDGDGYEKYLSLAGDGRVSKVHCAIVHRGDKLYLKDEGSRNGTYLNGTRIERPVVIQKEDMIGAGETKLEVLKILRESE